MDIKSKKRSWSKFKEILFTYLAINKIMYWFNTITALNQSDIEGVGQAVFMRVLNQDLIVILAVGAFFFFNELLESKKSKYGQLREYIIFYVFGYVGLLGIVFCYFLILNLFFPIQDFSFVGYVREFITALPSLSIGYLVVAIVLEIKLYFKKKGKEKDIVED